MTARLASSSIPNKTILSASTLRHHQSPNTLTPHFTPQILEPPLISSTKTRQESNHGFLLRPLRSLRSLQARPGRAAGAPAIHHERGAEVEASEWWVLNALYTSTSRREPSPRESTSLTCHFLSFYRCPQPHRYLLQQMHRLVVVVAVVGKSGVQGADVHVELRREVL